MDVSSSNLGGLLVLGFEFHGIAVHDLEPWLSGPNHSVVIGLRSCREATMRASSGTRTHIADPDVLTVGLTGFAMLPATQYLGMTRRAYGLDHLEDGLAQVPPRILK
jgi:hypothetical protein